MEQTLKIIVVVTALDANSDILYLNQIKLFSSSFFTTVSSHVWFSSVICVDSHHLSLLMLFYYAYLNS